MTRFAIEQPSSLPPFCRSPSGPFPAFMVYLDWDCGLDEGCFPNFYSVLAKQNPFSRLNSKKIKPLFTTKRTDKMNPPSPIEGSYKPAPQEETQ